MHVLDGQHQYRYMDRSPYPWIQSDLSPFISDYENDRRIDINGESTSMVWPTLGLRMANGEDS